MNALSTFRFLAILVIPVLVVKNVVGAEYGLLCSFRQSGRVPRVRRVLHRAGARAVDNSTRMNTSGIRYLVVASYLAWATLGFGALEDSPGITNPPSRFSGHPGEINPAAGDAGTLASRLSAVWEACTNKPITVLESNYLSLVAELTNSTMKGQAMYEIVWRYCDRSDRRLDKCIEYCQGALACPLTEEQECRTVVRMSATIFHRLHQLDEPVDSFVATQLRVQALTNLLQGLKVTQAKVRQPQMMELPEVPPSRVFLQARGKKDPLHEEAMRKRVEVMTSNKFFELQQDLKAQIVSLYRSQSPYRTELASEGRRILGDSPLLAEILTAVEKR